MIKKSRGSSARVERAANKEKNTKSKKIDFSDIPSFPTSSCRDCDG
jgi:hypothetical protein